MLRIKQLCLVVFAFLLLVSCDDGTTKTYWENGKLKSALRYEDGKLNGECLWYHSNGQMAMKTYYCNDLKEGRLQRWCEDGTLTEDCWYKAGQLDSVYRTYSNKGNLISEVYYADGKLNGKFMKWYENGQVFQDGQYVDGMMDGNWYIFYPEGTLASMAHYDKGRGKQTGYDEMGCKIMEVTYLDNKKHGKEIRYAPNGAILQVIEYEHGVVKSETDSQ